LCKELFEAAERVGSEDGRRGDGSRKTGDQAFEDTGRRRKGVEIVPRSGSF